MMTCAKCGGVYLTDFVCEECAALPPVRSEPLLADQLAAAAACVAALRFALRHIDHHEALMKARKALDVAEQTGIGCTANNATDQARAGSPSPEAGCSASDPRIFACDHCGRLRNVAEGGNIFTLCDECWDKHFKTPNARSHFPSGSEVK